MDTQSKLARHKFLIIALVTFVIYLVINFMLKSYLSMSSFVVEHEIITHFNAIILSICGGSVVGMYFQYDGIKSVSQQHLSLLEQQREYNESGIVKYYKNWGDAVEDLRLTIAEAQNVTMYVVYGRTILNNLKEVINSLLYKKGAVLNVYIMSEDNPFVQNYGKLWKYDRNKMISLIRDTYDSLEEKVEELSKEKKYKGKVNIYLNDKYPVNSSFYFCDDILFFHPSKHYEAKDLTSFVIKAKKTIDNDSLYNKVKEDLDRFSKNFSPKTL